MRKPVAAFIMSKRGFRLIYADPVYRRLREMIDLAFPPCEPEQFKRYRKECEEVEVLFTGWGPPLLDADFLDSFPNLKVVFHGAGTIREMVSPAFWERDILISSCHHINAQFVSDYCLGSILLGLKGVFYYQRKLKEEKEFLHGDQHSFPGMHHTMIGLCSYGSTARLLRQKIRTWGFKVYVYDPYLDVEEAENEDVRLIGLEELFKRCHLVSVHTPLLEDTCGMIGEDLICSMPPNAMFINTARGKLINMGEFYRAVERRRDIQFILDVTDPEYPPKGHRIYSLDNVFVTPHIAGATAYECVALGSFVVEEFKRYLEGEALVNSWNSERVSISA